MTTSEKPPAQCRWCGTPESLTSFELAGVAHHECKECAHVHKWAHDHLEAFHKMAAHVLATLVAEKLVDAFVDPLIRSTLQGESIDQLTVDPEHDVSIGKHMHVRVGIMGPLKGLNAYRVSVIFNRTDEEEGAIIEVGGMAALDTRDLERLGITDMNRTYCMDAYHVGDVLILRNITDTGKGTPTTRSDLH